MTKLAQASHLAAPTARHQRDDHALLRQTERQPRGCSVGT